MRRPRLRCHGQQTVIRPGRRRAGVYRQRDDRRPRWDPGWRPVARTDRSARRRSCPLTGSRAVHDHLSSCSVPAPRSVHETPGRTDRPRPARPAGWEVCPVTDVPGAPERRLDGNAAGGVLGEVLAVDPTTAVSTCVHCGASGPLGQHLVYADAPALVLRCPSCMQVVLRCASDTAGLRLEMTGVRLLRMTREGSGSL
ncbi:DUF6510 family protein [Geodermatophilus sp. SYSU D01186]